MLAARAVRRIPPVLRYIKATLASGFVFLVPVAVLVFLFVKAAPLMRRLARPFEGIVPMDTLFGVLVADLIVVVILLAACFVAGLIARVSFASRFVNKAETGLLWRIPGYTFIKAMVDSIDNKGNPTLRPVLIRFDDSSQLAFEVDRLPDGRRIIYVPGAPEPRAGSVIVMDANRVEPVPMTFLAALRSMRQLGRGVASSLTGLSQLTPPPK
jgi:uncharacterized membrane protein